VHLLLHHCKVPRPTCSMRSLLSLTSRARTKPHICKKGVWTVNDKALSEVKVREDEVAQDKEL
jgi:hypothetical protein